MLRVVVLPQPEGPTMMRNSPSSIRRFTPATATTEPKCLTRSRSTISATSFLPRTGRRPQCRYRLPHFRIIPKLKPLMRCFWISTPRTTTGIVITVPMAACGP